ncbi:DNA-binding PadR family transcriptional regulator [Catenuloplanes nepalensis]|uniref:DNA-binding PadR family transcriptional regulator n=1 Tax=Catenuloplanes nepalensis TaxID=587533 RepID=A0ABT9N546_9ACTN|nr:PadR family transcriptional regulator [Catenuloplanes nepalensis]MDP9798812.1 DNA-binding PadR family transcriptional regulator [Catenuloplanes nepalensis]
MSTSHVLLGLLANGPKHGYELKRAHDAHMPRAKPLAFGQVYATLGRLQRDGLVTEGERDRDAGPERTSFALTDAGRERLDEWLAEVEAPAPFVASALLAKVVVALLAADSRRAGTYLAAQRAAHAARLRELTLAKLDPDTALGDVIAADFAISHLDADLRWMETTIARVDDLHQGADT